MNIGKKIKELRILRHFTQEELALKLNVTPQAVSRWECEASLPDISMIPLLSKVLFVTADELLECDCSVGIKLFDSCNNLDLSGEILSQKQIDIKFRKRDIASDGIPKKVLVVDDADFMRMMLKDNLAKAGHEVMEAHDADSAISILKRSEADIIILDINMPRMNGLDFLRAGKTRDAKVIMLSALCSESIVNASYELGANAFVAKPFQIDSIIKRV